MWQPIETAPKDRAVLLWFPAGPFACPGVWSIISGGDEDGTGSEWAWVIADDLSEHHDGVVWADSPHPTLWAEVPN